MLKSIKKNLFLLGMVSLLIMMVGCNDDSTSNNNSEKTAKYVFLFIGDGVASVQSSAAEFFLEKNGAANAQLAFNKFPVQGTTTTRSEDSYITDSAAAGTALATGYKTNSGVISMDSSKTEELRTIAEMAKAQGKKVGIISSVTINHATPAVFYSHATSRSNYYEIGEELASSGFDYFAGGDINKKDDALITKIRDAGYTYVNTEEEINALTENSGKIVAVHPKAAQAWGAFPYTVDLDEDDMNLAEFTAKGIEVMENNKEGFFMMVEGGKIDWACHANDAKAAIMDVIAFDDAVKVAIEFYNQHPDETSIIVTGDHETGGMALGFSLTGYSSYYERLAGQTVSLDGFTGNASYTTYKNEHNKTTANILDLKDLIESSYGLLFLTEDEKVANEAIVNDETATVEAKKVADLKLAMNLNSDEIEDLEKALISSLPDAATVVSRGVYDSSAVLYGGYDHLGVTLNHILNNKAGISWTTYSHSGIPVVTYAKGVSADLFGGYYDNTDVAKKIMSIMGVE